MGIKSSNQKRNVTADPALPRRRSGSAAKIPDRVLLNKLSGPARVSTDLTRRLANLKGVTSASTGAGVVRVTLDPKAFASRNLRGAVLRLAQSLASGVYLEIRSAVIAPQ